VTVLRPLIAPNNTINVNPGNNSLVITDYADNLLRLSKIIAALDAPASSEPEVIPIRHAAAGDIASMVTRLLEPGGSPAGAAGQISLLVESRTNAVIVRAPSQARANLAKSLIAQLDQPTEHPGNVHVVYLKNAEATQLAKTLRAVMSSDVSSPAPVPPGQPNSHCQAAVRRDSFRPTQPPIPSSSLQRDGLPKFAFHHRPARCAACPGIYRITDRRSKRHASRRIRHSMGGLSGDGSSTYRVGGVTGFGSGGDNLISQAAASSTGSPLPPGNGLSLGIFRQTAGKLGLGVLARALASDDDANILSMPI